MATEKDEGEIYSFLVSLWSHNKNGWGFAYDPMTVLAQIEVGTRPDPRVRTDRNDQRRGLIGIIRSDSRKIVASVGLFIMPPVWFTTIYGMTELWLHVAKGSRDRARREKDLFDFAKWAHQYMKADLAKKWSAAFPLSTGFMHDGPRYDAMERLWRMRSGGRQIGSLFLVD